MGETKDPTPRATSSSGPTLLRPGADLPLDAYVADKADILIYATDDAGKKAKPARVEKVTRFPSAVLEEEWKSNSVTLRERAMMAVIDLLSDKPGWEDKVNDEAITAKWRKEALAMPIKQGFSDKMFDYVLAELQDKAALFKKNGRVTSVYDGAAAVFKNDSALDDEITCRLRNEVGKLENVPDDEKDWHPGSNEQVLDIVHPSLWPLIYGKTRVVKDREIALKDTLDAWGKGETIPAPEKPVEKKNRWGWSHDTNRLLSYDFQWLPAEVEVKDGKAQFVSYINNLHPEESKEMYAVLETLVERVSFVGGWDTNAHAQSLPLWHAAYDRVMQWMGSEDGLPWDSNDKARVTRVWCMDSNRQCTTPKICNRYCDAYNNPATRSDNGSDDEEEGEGEGANVEGSDAEADEEGADDVDAAKDEDDNKVEDNDEDVENVFEDENDDAVSSSSSLERTLAELEMSQSGDEALLAEEYGGGSDAGSGGDSDADSDVNSVSVSGSTKAALAEAEEADKAPPADGVTPEISGYDTDDDANQKWFAATHPITQPEPSDYKFLGYDYSKPNAFANARLQVIVKLANIHLTPDKPSYNGGSWHVEGQLNERIVATALYYYDNENVTDSHLAFRTPCDAETMVENFGYEQSDHVPFAELYGANPGMDEHSTNFEFGKVLTRQGRLLVFPNVLQHRVGSFKLADPTKPGHRKIVALFLVDPLTPVISTANVPPQQMHWGTRVRSVIEDKLPPEIANMVYKEMSCPFKLDEAKKIREKLIDERKALDKEANKAVNHYDWSFCEH